MKGKISVVSAISEFGDDAHITTRALVRRANGVIKKNSNSNALVAKPRYDIKNLDTAQYILALHKKMHELDTVDKSSVKVRLDNLDAEYINTVSHNTGEPYDAVIVNLGTPEEPITRRYYLTKTQSKLIRKPEFKPEYEFTYVENTFDEEDDVEETE